MHVILTSVPTRSAWQAAIRKAGIDLVLDPKFNPRRSNGFVSARFIETTSGFGFSIGSVSDSAPGYLRFVTSRARPKLSANFTWNGDELEMCCALSAAAALAKLTKGPLFEPADGVCYSAEEAIQIAKDETADFVTGGTEWVRVPASQITRRCTGPRPRNVSLKSKDRRRGRGQ